MVRKIAFIFLIFSFFNRVCAQTTAKIDQIKINSKELNQKREFFVFTPTIYSTSPYSYYDVIYVFDAQNRELFDYTHSIISFLSNTSKNYIVVGIISPYYEKQDYGRNNDMLPVLQSEESKKRYGKYSGNADNFLKYVKNEVVPYVEANYRTLSHRTAVGHSLSASFILYSMFNAPELFDNYIAISPNFAFDNERLVKDLSRFDFNTIKTTQYLYVSNADEGIDYWQEWKPAREKAHSFLNDSLKSDNIKVVIKDFSSETHWSTFPPSLNFALTYYFNQISEQQQNELSTAEYEVTILVKVPNKNDELYITGNQTSLGNWNPGLVKMTKKSDFEREIKVKLHSPAQFKFTKGSWDTEAEVKNGEMQNLTIKPEKQQKYKFEIVKYNQTN